MDGISKQKKKKQQISKMDRSFKSWTAWLLLALSGTGKRNFNGH